jgi:hypothetical protein
MSNIKKARYTIAIKPLNPKLSVIKVTGTSKNIKQINYFLPKGYGLMKKNKPVYSDEPLFLYKEIDEAGIKGTIALGFPEIGDWIVVTEDNHVDKISKENFDEIITLVD